MACQSYNLLAFGLFLLLLSSISFLPFSNGRAVAKAAEPSCPPKGKVANLPKHPPRLAGCSPSSHSRVHTCLLSHGLRQQVCVWRGLRCRRRRRRRPRAACPPTPTTAGRVSGFGPSTLMCLIPVKHTHTPLPAERSAATASPSRAEQEEAEGATTGTSRRCTGRPGRGMPPGCRCCWPRGGQTSRNWTSRTGTAGRPCTLPSAGAAPPAWTCFWAPGPTPAAATRRTAPPLHLAAAAGSAECVAALLRRGACPRGGGKGRAHAPARGRHARARRLRGGAAGRGRDPHAWHEGRPRQHGGAVCGAAPGAAAGSRAAGALPAAGGQAAGCP